MKNKLCLSLDSGETMPCST